MKLKERIFLTVFYGWFIVGVLMLFVNILAGAMMIFAVPAMICCIVGIISGASGRQDSNLERMGEPWGADGPNGDGSE